jgi:hypothetical protein
MITTFHTLPCNGLPYKLSVKDWFRQNTLSLLKECRCLYLITQMHKSLNFSLLKCFITKAIYHWHFQIASIPPHQKFGSHPIDIGFLKKQNLIMVVFVFCDSTIIHW